MKTGDLVKYIPTTSTTFKWETYINTESRNPGIIIKEVDRGAIATRRFLVRWHNGKVTEEWASYLEPLNNSLTT